MKRKTNEEFQNPNDKRYKCGMKMNAIWYQKDIAEVILDYVPLMGDFGSKNPFWIFEEIATTNYCKKRFGLSKYECLKTIEYVRHVNDIQWGDVTDKYSIFLMGILNTIVSPEFYREWGHSILKTRFWGNEEPIMDVQRVREREAGRVVTSVKINLRWRTKDIQYLSTKDKLEAPKRDKIMYNLDRKINGKKWTSNFSNEVQHYIKKHATLDECRFKYLKIMMDPNRIKNELECNPDGGYNVLFRTNYEGARFGFTFNNNKWRVTTLPIFIKEPQTLKIDDIPKEIENICVVNASQMYSPTLKLTCTSSTFDNKKGPNIIFFGKFDIRMNDLCPYNNNIYKTCFSIVTLNFNFLRSVCLTKKELVFMKKWNDGIHKPETRDDITLMDLIEVGQTVYKQRSGDEFYVDDEFKLEVGTMILWIKLNGTDMFGRMKFKITACAIRNAPQSFYDEYPFEKKIDFVQGKWDGNAIVNSYPRR